MKKLFISGIFMSLFLSEQVFSQSVSITPAGDEILVTKYGSGTPNLAGRQSNGSSATPTASTNGLGLASFSGRGHSGSSFTSDRATILMSADETFTSTAQGTRITFNTTLNGTAFQTERMRIDNTGFVGIGTVNPLKRMHVSSGSAGIASYVSSSNFLVESNFSHYIQMGSPEAQETGILFGKPSNSASGGIIYNGNNGLNLRTGGNLNRMTINSDGDVGIGTITPSTKLNMSSGNFLMETGSTDKILLKQDGVGSAGEGIFYTNTGVRSLEIRGSDGTGTAGEINLYIPSTQVKTIEIDGDYAGSGKSRIIVDELQIKGGSDLAEFFKINTLMKLEAGTVVSVSEDNSGNLELTKNAYDKKVVGIISGANGVSTGLMLHQKGNEIVDGDYPIAINGRVYVKAEATKNPIKAGDLLTSSDIDGYAMKSINNKKAHGAVIGKALTGLDKETGLVLVLLGVK